MDSSQAIVSIAVSGGGYSEDVSVNYSENAQEMVPVIGSYNSTYALTQFNLNSANIENCENSGSIRPAGF
jgi:hypothetical protein